MRALLISANTEKINMPVLPLGLACVASSKKSAGHDVAMVDLNIEKDTPTVLKEAIEEFHPDIIGISVRNIDDQRMESPRLLLDPVRDIVKVCRDHSEASIVLGGAGYSIFPESVLSFLDADMGIQGEGEIVFPEFLKRIEQGASLLDLSSLCLRGYGLRCKRSFAKDLDKLSLPDPDLWPALSQKEEIWMPVQTRRECPLSCSYCSTGTIEGRPIRRRSPKITTGVRIYPRTLLAEIATEEGMISSQDDLLLPRFYLVKGLEDWLPETLENWMATRPHWMI